MCVLYVCGFRVSGHWCGMEDSMWIRKICKTKLNTCYYCQILENLLRSDDNNQIATKDDDAWLSIKIDWTVIHKMCHQRHFPRMDISSNISKLITIIIISHRRSNCNLTFILFYYSIILYNMIIIEWCVCWQNWLSRRYLITRLMHILFANQ